MQQEFLDLFRGLENCHDEKVEKDKKKKKKKKKKDKKKNKDGHKNQGKDKDESNSGSDEDEEEDDNGDDESMEADYRAEIEIINGMCPRGQFFYSMSPYHVEAWTTLARLFVGKPIVVNSKIRAEYFFAAVKYKGMVFGPSGCRSGETRHDWIFISASY